MCMFMFLLLLLLSSCRFEALLYGSRGDAETPAPPSLIRALSLAWIHKFLPSLTSQLWKNIDDYDDKHDQDSKAMQTSIKLHRNPWTLLIICCEAKQHYLSAAEPQAPSPPKSILPLPFAAISAMIFVLCLLQASRWYFQNFYIVSTLCRVYVCQYSSKVMLFQGRKTNQTQEPLLPTGSLITNHTLWRTLFCSSSW